MDSRFFENLALYGGEIRVDYNDTLTLSEVRKKLSDMQLPREIKLWADSPVDVYYKITVHPRRPSRLMEAA